MTQSIELLLDDATENAVRAEWEALSQAGLPSMADHPGETNRPHITMAVADEIPPDVEAAVTGLAAQVPFPARLGALTCFGRGPGRFILVRLVVPSAQLLAVQAEAARLVRGQPGTGQHLQPGAWTPHATLSRRLSIDQTAVALEVLSELPDLTGHAVAVRRWDSIAREAWVVRRADKPNG